MTREEAIEIVKTQYSHDTVMTTALGMLIPELQESDDERIRKALINGMKYLRNRMKTLFCDLPINDVIAWLEKQKEQKPVKCIEFDNEFKSQVSHLLVSVLNKEWEYDKGFVEYAAQQLLGYAKHEIKSAEWSEEDETIIEGACNALETYGHTKLASMLKSLRPSWKPSEEQMKALLWCTAHLGGADHRVLAELYEQLKKL